MRIYPNFLEEEKLWQKGYQYICGVDEVGRGSWAGPVVAAAVIFKSGVSLVDYKIQDSKTLSSKERESLVPVIKELSLSFGIGEVSSEELDEIGIMKATFKAMRKAMKGLMIQPNFCLVDGRDKILGFNRKKQKAIIRGDGKSFSIAAASILAKVYRDHLMYDYHWKYSFYGFRTNVGYGTKKHREGIEKVGICSLHRKSFVPEEILFKLD